ncbi:MAG: hypothetical protein ACREQZ_07725, partial [Woeseiaceae bacterium]
IMHTAALTDGDPEPVASFDFGLAIPESFVFSPDGRYLFGSSYYTGVSNIFRYEPATGELEAVSNAETGFFRPVPLADGSLIVFHYTGQGLVPAIIDPVPLEDVSSITFLGRRVVEKHPQLREWQVGSPARVSLDDVVTGQGTYSPTRNIGFESSYPILEGYKNTVAAGLNLSFSDPVMLDTLKVSATYSLDASLPADERPHISIDYRHIAFRDTPLAGTWTAGARRNHADFYDLFGPTKEGLKGNWLYLGYDKTLLYDQPRKLAVRTELNHYTDMDRLPRYQNVDIAFDRLTTFDVELSYSHLRSSLGHVDDEKGFEWRVIGAADYVNEDTIPKFAASFDFGFPLWWGHSSLWFRNSAGFAIGEPLDEFANFYFGGFGNNYVDRGEVKRYREIYAMPGFELNQISGRNFYRSMIEFNVPPLRFERAGRPGFYLSWARPAVFATALVTGVDSSESLQDVYSLGAQIDLRFTVLSRMDMTLSLGYAVADGQNVDRSDEIMVSLKIL